MTFTIVTLFLSFASSLYGSNSNPNIVLFYIDDWAWNGTPVAMDDTMPNSKMPVLNMPNVKRLAEEGMKFRNAFGSPQCSPARAALQTGQSNPRNGLTVYLNSQEPYFNTQKEYAYFPLVSNVSNRQLNPDATTIAEALNPLGYASAHVGKWHMRGNPGQEGYIVHDGDTTNSPGNTIRTGLPKGAPPLHRLPKDLSDPKLMFSITQKAIKFIHDQHSRGVPFYVQISHYAMHEGPECLDKTREKYVRHPLVQSWYKKNKKDPETVKRKEDPANWLAMGEDLDGRIGAVLKTLSDLNIEKNTYVILVSDNGYRHSQLGLNPSMKQPLHAKKWWLWDGGIRVPMIAKGPGIPKSSTFYANVVNYDFLPTFVDLAGGDWKKLKNIDGISLKQYLLGKSPDETFRNRNLYFHYPHYRSSVPHSVIISGSKKVIHFYHQPKIKMLFDLSIDPGETKNIADVNHATHQRLHNELMTYLKSVGARLPKWNPNYDLNKYKSDKKTIERLQYGPFEGKRELDIDEM